MFSIYLESPRLTRISAKVRRSIDYIDQKSGDKGYV